MKTIYDNVEDVEKNIIAAGFVDFLLCAASIVAVTNMNVLLQKKLKFSNVLIKHIYLHSC